jgi:hypothetical protein
MITGIDDYRIFKPAVPVNFVDNPADISVDIFQSRRVVLPYLEALVGVIFIRTDGQGKFGILPVSAHTFGYVPGVVWTVEIHHQMPWCIFLKTLQYLKSIFCYPVITVCFLRQMGGIRFEAILYTAPPAIHVLYMGGCQSVVMKVLHIGVPGGIRTGVDGIPFTSVVDTVSET